MRTMEVVLPNGSDGDALVLVRRLHAGRCLLFDAGDTRRLAGRDVLALDHLLVSHAHVDHFVGFDALVRPRVCREDRLSACGPEGFLARVQARLAGYTWNLVEGNHFSLTAREVLEDRVRVARFDSGRAFAREDLPDEPRDVLEGLDPDFAIGSEALDHHVISQGWSVRGRRTWSVRAERLPGLGLAPGPWLRALKDAAESNADRSAPYQPPGGAVRPLGEWFDELLAPQPGDRVAFVTDTACTAVTRPRIVKLAEGADVFACGAPFLERDADRARLTRHLTARQAGEMAAEAGVRALLLFHVSDRYGGRWEEHVEEASAAARGACEVAVQPPGAVIS